VLFTAKNDVILAESMKKL